MGNAEYMGTTQHGEYTSGHIQVMDNFHFYFFLIMLVFTILILIPLKCYYCCRTKTIREPRERQEDIRNSVRREPGPSQEDVWSISIPETSELPDVFLSFSWFSYCLCPTT